MLFSGNLRSTHLMFSKQAITLIKKNFIVLFIIIIFRKIFLKQQPSMKLNKFLKTKERFGFFSVYFIKYSVQYASKSRQQVVFALLVPSCQQVCNKLLTICNNLIDVIRLVAGLFQ
jgi:hypothetical protein